MVEGGRKNEGGDRAGMKTAAIALFPVTDSSPNPNTCSGCAHAYMHFYTAQFPSTDFSLFPRYSFSYAYFLNPLASTEDRKYSVQKG